ncbi:QueT transporter family protein [Lactococcus insecticola]|uniref:Queuosine transporter QueT n=1 Tax=Pseudolactococcus insecticola TaxID=2709158 RepID=A0A6A0B8D8_9LACT|nr:QueT transporter family protein [Lactococcus insecticola]GFH40718.1 queuosine transporter QueT [Lactococcus insecticola]
MSNKITITDIVKIAIVAALYVAVTMAPGLNAISSGAIQFRLSEMFNFLAFYNKRYIIAVTIGCMISNLLTYGIVDVFVGGLSTLLFVTLGVLLFDRFKGKYLIPGVLNLGFFYFSIFFAVSMFTIAAELKIMYDTPFFITWLTTGLGEFVSLIIGSIIIDRLSKLVDFVK